MGITEKSPGREGNLGVSPGVSPEGSLCGVPCRIRWSIFWGCPGLSPWDPVEDPQAGHQNGMMQATVLYNAERLLKSALKFGMLLLPRATLDQRINY